MIVGETFFICVCENHDADAGCGRLIGLGCVCFALLCWVYVCGCGRGFFLLWADMEGGGCFVCVCVVFSHPRSFGLLFECVGIEWKVYDILVLFFGLFVCLWSE